MKTLCLLSAIALIVVGVLWLSYLAVGNDVSPAAFAPALAIVFFGLAFFVLGEICGKLAAIEANTRKPV